MAKECISVDIDARTDIKVQKMMSDYGYTGFGYYWAIVVELYKSGGRYGLSDFSILAKAVDIRKDKLKTFILNCCDKYTHNGVGLFSRDDTHFWSDSLLRRMKKPTKKMRTSIDFMRFDNIDCVHLTEEDYNKLCDKHGSTLINTGIKILDNWLSKGGKSAQSYLGKEYNHKGHFRSDSWVLNEAKKLISQPKDFVIPSEEELLKRLKICK